jgi:nucleotide-binding universal stress UspA family protein
LIQSEGGNFIASNYYAFLKEIMKNILVPIDFSEASHNAAKYAVSLAKPFDARVTLINVIPPAVIIDDSVLAFVMTTQAEIVTSHKELMDKEIEELSGKDWIKIKGLVEEGSTNEVIQQIAKLKETDIIVMGMKGKGKSNSVFGSTTTKVIRKSVLPVFVIPEKAEFKPIDSITFASDFDEEIEIDRYSLLVDLSEKFNSQIYILNVQKNDYATSASEVLGKINTNEAFSNFNHEFHTINENNVEKGINKFIETYPTDILAMVAHTHNLFERMFGKVHTKEMSYQTKIPLLVLQDK